jgi:hypothetical protein
MNKRTYRIVNTSKEDPYIVLGEGSTSQDYWKFGDDNLFPQAIALLNRRSTVHRGILKSKSLFIGGKGLQCDEKDTNLSEWLKSCNAYGENLRDVFRKVVYDKKAFGNAYIEIVTKAGGGFVNVYHQDATRCRLSKDKKRIILHHDWWRYMSLRAKSKELPIYPVFEDTLKDGYLRSVIHLKEYEPEFENYGLMDWVAGLQVSAIAYKTDRWNVSRLDNSFNSSGVLVVSGEFSTQEEYEEFVTDFEKQFVGDGTQGKILMLAQKPGQDANAGTRFIPVTQAADGDWQSLHTQTTGDLVIAHNWFRSLAGIADNTGFDTQRILNEYEVALNTVILDEQEILLSLIKKILWNTVRVDGSSISFINRPPATAKPQYMKIWEARKVDGLDYDENDPAQQLYLANITAAKTITIS